MDLTIGAGIAIAAGLVSALVGLLTLFKHLTSKSENPEIAVLKSEVEELQKRLDKLYDLILNKWTGEK